MDDYKELADELTQKSKDLGKTSAEIIRLKVLDKTSDVLSNAISWIPIALVLFVFFVAANIGAGYYIGDYTGYGNAIGFFILAGAYLSLGILLLILRKPLIKNPIVNSLIRKFMKKEDK